MTIPHMLALDFDGVRCDGMCEYVEESRRTQTPPNYVVASIPAGR
jgi:hypothetical protein